MSYITLQEVMDLWRPLTTAEQATVTTLIPYAEAYLRQAARDLGEDLDARISSGETDPLVVKAVAADMLRRYISSVADESAPMSQTTQSALGYSLTGTYLVPGGGWFLKENEKRALGLKKQKAGVIDFVGY